MGAQRSSGGVGEGTRPNSRRARVDPSESVWGDSKKRLLESGGWLIVDLSFPKHHSVNDMIDESVASLAHISVDSIVEVIVALGRGVYGNRGCEGSV